MSNDEQTQTTTKYLYEEEYHPPFLVAVVLAPPALPIFWNYHVFVTEEKLSFGYSYVFKREVERECIEKAELIEHIDGLRQWGGWGYKFNLSGQIGYIVKNGPGIRLTYKDGKGKSVMVVFNCIEAAKVCKILNTPVIDAVTY